MKILAAKLTVHRDSRTPFPRYPRPTEESSYWYSQRLPELPARQSQASRVYLDDLPEMSFHTSRGVLGKRGVSGRKDSAGFVFNKQQYDHGINMYPYSNGTARVVYNLDRHFKKFSAEIGVGEPDPSRIGKKIFSTLTYRVYGDGKLLAESGDHRVIGSKLPISADVTGVKTLTLQVKCNGKNGGAWATWLNPMVTR